MLPPVDYIKRRFRIKQRFTDFDESVRRFQDPAFSYAISQAELNANEQSRPSVYVFDN